MSKQLVLGIDGGGTGTSWSLCTWDGAQLRLQKSGKLGPGNMRLVSRATLMNLLRKLPSQAHRVGIFLAGCVTEQDRKALQVMGRVIWKDATISVGSDRESAYAAALGKGDGIVVIAGTGSAITGRSQGREERAGGRGHLLGDAGGGYDLSLQALRMALFRLDRSQTIHPIIPDILNFLGLNTLTELSSWAQSAAKDDIAALAPLLFHHRDDPAIAQILQGGAEVLAQLTAAVANRLSLINPKVRLAGGVFKHQPYYAEEFQKALRAIRLGAHVELTSTAPSLGAAWIAAEACNSLTVPEEDGEAPDKATLPQASTEQVNPRSANLDQMSPLELVELFVHEERCVEEALRHCSRELARGMEEIARSLRQGGRLFYAGAGTSGRLGVLDASEIPPTFGQPPERVQAIMAGGAQAIRRSVEGAEDDHTAGRQSVGDRGICKADIVCGLTASGRTPFVQGVLEEARARGCATLLITCNPQRSRDILRADICIDLPTGPEILAGSTRLKAGTATKVALNILSTGAMILLGHVRGNRMSHMVPSNAKLKQRAIHIVAEVAKMSHKEAKFALECTNWNIPSALNHRSQVKKIHTEGTIH